MAVVSADALRSEFDGVFALPVRERSEKLIDLLMIRVAGQSYALRVDEMSGVGAGRRVTKVPSPEPAFAGLVGIRGAIFAVYDLGVLLGLPHQASEQHWVALAAGDAQIALSFEELEGHLRLPPSELGANVNAGFCEHAVRTGNELRPVVSLPRIVSVVLERAARERPGKGDKRDG
ncbi:MAG TPA: chemotaxis protein CheW [Polyangiaceae bacterium]|nr:chemotaxis protein CheW [Polyangiaceae bacterium]